MAGIRQSLEAVYGISADLNLWFKIQAGDSYTLTDFPDIIPFRWEYFRDQWEFIREGYRIRISGYNDPDLLKTQIAAMTEFVDAQRNAKVNPFRKNDILYTFFAIFDTTELEAIALTNEEATLVEDRVSEVSRYKRDDFVKLRNDIVVVRDQYADIKNLSDETYNQVFSRGSVAGQTDANNFDMNQLKNMNDMISTINFILANEFSLNTSFVDPYAQARANANNSEIDIRTYSSGFLVSLPYGQDLRGLARNYLGNEDRWIEIAIANGLKPPYIDEVGEKVPLLANGVGNKITVSGVNSGGELNSDKIFVNQVVYLSSDTYAFPDQRVIVNIEEIPISNDIIIELDGEENLSQYKISENASLRIFKPQTINSSLKVLIPSTLAAPDSRKDITPWFLSTSTEDAKAMKIDLSINNKGELEFDVTNDLLLSYSYDNAQQAIQLMMQTKSGELFRHTNYGLIDITGTTTEEIDDLQSLLAESISNQVANDARFDRIETLNIQYSVTEEDADRAAGFDVGMVVKLAGSEQTLPITFRINT